MIKVAVLLAIHNRVNQSLECLKSFDAASKDLAYAFDIYIFDDGSTDDSRKIISSAYPNITFLKGDGNQYWSKGMNKVWSLASSKVNYDFYLWLNNDTNLLINGLVGLFNDYERVRHEKNGKAIITGSCRDSSGKWSYGGSLETGPCVPNGLCQQCRYMNGNVVLIPSLVFEVLGQISPDYTHSLGDFDYGLRALSNGVLLFSSSDYVACCDRNGLPVWMNASKGLRERFRNFNHPKGLNIKEYRVYLRKNFYLTDYLIRIIKAYMILLLPGFHRALKRFRDN